MKIKDLDIIREYQTTRYNEIIQYLHSVNPDVTQELMRKLFSIMCSLSGGLNPWLADYIEETLDEVVNEI